MVDVRRDARPNVALHFANDARLARDKRLRSRGVGAVCVGGAEVARERARGGSARGRGVRRVRKYGALRRARAVVVVVVDDVVRRPVRGEREGERQESARTCANDAPTRRDDAL